MEVLMKNFSVSDGIGCLITPIFVGHHACECGHSYGPYVREYYIIHMCLCGKGTLKNKDGVFSVNPGELFVIRPGEVTTYNADTTDPWEYTWISFRSDKELFNDGVSVFTTPQGIDDRLLQLVNSDFASRESCLALIYELICDLHHLKNDDLGDVKVRKIHRYIKYNYMLPISVNELAYSFGFERSYLYRIFKQKYGVGVKEYLTSVRMKRGKEFLSEGFSVKESAHMAGYEDEFNFSKVFKARYGVSPSEFKAKRGVIED